MANPLTVDAIRHELTAPGSWVVHVVDRLASTNTTALEWAASGAPHGTVLLAESQSAGRGRGDRSWRTPQGQALALSVILRPDLEADRRSWIGLAAAIAVVDAIDTVTGTPCRLKWPNDILIGPKKVGGVLTESRSPVDPVAPPAMVVGIGVNVNNRAAALPRDVRASSISLLDATGEVTDRNRLVAATLNALARVLESLRHGTHTLVERWTTVSATRGHHLAILTPQGLIEGTERGLDSTGRLILSQRDGSDRAVHSGEVLLCRTASPPTV
jgi:BirA family biotin operon repressor/biotin-[acetyl-CoA-carboxylase] ligase